VSAAFAILAAGVRACATDDSPSIGMATDQHYGAAMASGNAKRKRHQQQQARHRADKSHERDRTQVHEPLPKVGTRPEREHLHNQRQADLVDFGLGGRHRAVGLGLVVLAVLVLLGLLAVLVLFD
jgi:ferric-dicitrate binding protein FerR (iron transport regulator)